MCFIIILRLVNRGINEKMKRRSSYFLLFVLVALVSLLWASFAVAQEPEEEEGEEETTTALEPGAKEFEDFDPSNFDNPTQIDNEWWPLEPGTEFIYEGFDLVDGEETPHRIVTTVTDLTKVISDVRTVVIVEKDFSDDKLEEKELAFFAQDNDGNVWHFGQYVEHYEDTEYVGNRAWLVDMPEGAKAGIMMQAEPELGTPSYSQGYAPPPYYWTDRARTYQMGEKTSIALGDYDDVLVVEEFAEKEPGVFQLKYYARGVGNIRTGWRGDDTQQEELELIEVVKLDPEALEAIRTEALEMEERGFMYSKTSPVEPMPATE
jgi:hypothetical protein